MPHFVSSKAKAGRVVHFRAFILLVVLFITLLSLWFQTELTLNSYSYPAGIESQYYAIARNRSRMSRDEFHQKGPSEAEIAAYFRFDPSILADKSAALDRIWTCTEQGTLEHGRSNKLVYLQISRVAGSTVRTLFRAYAEYCKAGLAVVNHCLDLGLEYIQGDDFWANGKASRREGENCYLSYAVNRTGSETDLAPMSTSFLADVDILAGKIPLGSDQYWMDQQGRHVDVQYVVFVRDPLETFVSEVLLAHRNQNLTVTDAVVTVGRLTTIRRSTNRYRERYATHLLTPEQKAWTVAQRVMLSPARRTNLTLSNLAHKKILVGVTERMPESVKLLEYVIDKEHEVSSLFKFFGSDKRPVIRAKMANNNMTEPVVLKIRENPSLLMLLEEYLKYDQKIYDYAFRLHERQYQWLEEKLRRVKEAL